MSYTLLSEITRTAQKEHACIWCREKIAKGEKYIEERSVYEGIQFHRWHPECWSISSVYFRDEEEFEPHVCKRGTLEES